jgi:hypothetical protein
LILDEDGIYYPGDFNDRLLLGLKGTMSEAELHLIRALPIMECLVSFPYTRKIFMTEGPTAIVEELQ